MEKYVNNNKRSTNLQLNFDQQNIGSDVCSNALTPLNTFTEENMLRHGVMPSHFVNTVINDIDSLPPSPTFQSLPECMPKHDGNITPPLAVTTFSALNDSGSTSSSSSSEDEKLCTENIIQNITKDGNNISLNEDNFKNKFATSDISLLNNVSNSSASLSDDQQHLSKKSLPVSVVSVDHSQELATTNQSTTAAVKRPFSGLDDVLFNLADIPVESYSARQRSTINSEHHKEEARAQRQREREAERQGSIASAALAAQNSMHAVSGVGLHHVGPRHHAANVSCHSSTGVHHSANASNQYNTHYGGSSVVPTLHHLQSHHSHNPTQQFHPHQQYSAHQHQSHLISSQLLQTQHALPSGIYSTYGLSQVPSAPEFSNDYRASYSSTSSHVHNVSQLPPPPPAHQQLQTQPLTQHHHGMPTLPPLPHQPSNQQSMLSIQPIHQPSSAHQSHQHRLTPQLIHQQPQTIQPINQPHMTQKHVHQPQPVKVLTPSSVAPSPAAAPPSVSPSISQSFQQGVSVTHNASPLVGHQITSAQTSPSSASNTSGGYCGSSTSENHMQSIVGSNGVVNYSCKVCGKVYNNRSSLRSHVKKHYPEEEKPFKCQQCTYSSHYRANLMKHMSTNHAEDCEQHSLLLCDVCQKSFVNEEEMQEHLKLHNIDGNICHRCEQCNKSFKTKLCLKHHMDVHNPKKPFVCDVDSCDRAFRTAKYLKNHKDDFHQLQPKRFECQVDKCEMVFHKKTHLKGHMVDHSCGEKNLQCTWDGCRKRFSGHDALRNHVAKHELGQVAAPFNCELCDFKCHHMNSLNVHYRVVHNKSIDPAQMNSINARLTDQLVNYSSSDEDSSDEDEDDEDDDSSGELPPPLLPSQRSQEVAMHDFQKSRIASSSAEACGQASTNGPPNLANATVNEVFSDSEDIKLDSQINGIITNLEEENNLMGMNFVESASATPSSYPFNKLSFDIDKIVMDIVARCDNDLPSTIGLSQFTEQEIFLIRESFILANTPLCTTNGGGTLTCAAAAAAAASSVIRKRHHSQELSLPSLSHSNLSPQINEVFARNHVPSSMPSSHHHSISNFEPIRCGLDMSDSPQPPSLEQQQPPPLVAQVINSSGGDIPDIISSVTSATGGCKDIGGGDSPRKSDQRDLLDEVLEDIQQLQDKEMQSKHHSIDSSKCGNNNRFAPLAQVNHMSGHHHHMQQQQQQQPAPQTANKSLEKNIVWNDSSSSSTLFNTNSSTNSSSNSKKANLAKQTSRSSAPDTNKVNSLMAGLDAAATGSLSSLFRPNMATAAAAADLYSNYYRQQAQAYGMAPPSSSMPPVAQAVAAAYDPYRSLSALGSKYMDATAAGYAAAVPGWPPVSVTGRSPNVSIGYSVPSTASVASNVGSTGLCMTGSNIPGGTNGMSDSLHMTSAALHPSHAGWPNPLATPGANSVPSDYMSVPGYSDYLGRAFDPKSARSSLEAYRGSAAASELYSQMVAASAGSYSQFYGQAAAARDGLAYAGVAANSRFASDSSFQPKQPAPSYSDTRSYLPGSAGYPYSALSASPYARVAGVANPYGQAATDYLGRVAGAAAFGPAAASAAAAGAAYATTSDPYRNTMLHNMSLNRYPF